MGELVQWMLDLMTQYGALGIFLGIIIESVFTPIPSELVMAWAGYLVYKGEINLWVAIFSATIGTVIGSLILYTIGRIFGDKVIEKAGKLIGVDKYEYEKLKKTYSKHGSKAVLFAQVIPGIRSMIGIYAGVVKLSIPILIINSFLGGLVWNFTLIYLAMLFGENWEKLADYVSKIENVAYVFTGLLIIFICYKLYKKYNKKELPIENSDAK